jgi:uncharacterized protein with PQ loop repeat
MEYKKYQWIAIISGVFAILGFSHLVFNVYYTKKTDNLTFIWLFLVISAQTLLIIYGLLNKSYGIYLPPILLISGLLYILYVKLTYENLTYENLTYETLTYEK